MAQGPNLANHLFLYSVQSKDGLHICNGWKKLWRIFYDTWILYEIQISMSINKILLKYSHTDMFTHCLWLLIGYSSRAEKLWQGQSTKLKLFIMWTIIVKVCQPLIYKGWLSEGTEMEVYLFNIQECLQI